ncbi:unnamed protein product [Brachionus calyciflorus]|uniref:Voltage-gated hydrogen channel 1 n=1 Tax=Brachionus calyciflorus TaxID=104777 RepID=A0A813TNW1_9BILA|nr:unnamed protein product [Brachionus calyciflorus]
MQTPISENNRYRPSESLINVFDYNSEFRKKSDLDIESINMNVITEQAFEDTQSLPKDPLSTMSKEDILTSIFGPALNINDKNISLYEKIRRILLSNYMHVAIIFLVILDSLCVTCELIIEAENKKESHSLEGAEDFFKYSGFIILCIFMIEIMFKLIFIFDEFRHSKLEIVDALIVLISFIAEIIFMKSKSVLSAVFGLISIFRFWRIIRIVNGFTMTVEKRSEAKIEKLKEGMNSLIREIDSLKIELNNKQALLDQIKVVKDFQ